MSGNANDDGLVAHMRMQIVEYQQRSQSLEATVDGLQWAFSMGSQRLRRTRDELDEQLLFLGAVVASGSDHSMAVDRALDEIDAALRRVLEQHAA